MDDVDLLFEDIEDEIQNTMINEIIPIVENELHEQSVAIYDEFTALSYVSRYEKKEEGSFGDREMINTEIQGSIKNGILEIITTNDAKAVGDDEGEYLDDIIEYGDRYEWTHKPPARPVFERTMEELNASQIIENIIERNLKTQGYDIK